jgi:hypothetical protein
MWRAVDAETGLRSEFSKRNLQSQAAKTAEYLAVANGVVETAAVPRSCTIRHQDGQILET